MPRPGPRPYECVRRVWHSDRHQPIRGSLIQEIFRIVIEIHSSSTRKNREWQDKLPIVALKAEEIMYSKANSEAEYSDFKTLWDRLNDAINTIIRRDETTETGELLQPCIEAALNLGCIPRRSSRSQRNETPRSYLRPETPGTTSHPLTNSNAPVYRNLTNNSPLMLQCPQFLTHINMDTDNSAKELPILPNNMQSCYSPNTWSVYPLYYNHQIHPDDSTLCAVKPSDSSFRQLENNNQLCLPQNLPPPPCDLTLRLGSPPCTIKEPLNVEYGNSRTRVEKRKLKSSFR